MDETTIKFLLANGSNMKNKKSKKLMKKYRIHIAKLKTYALKSIYTTTSDKFKFITFVLSSILIISITDCAISCH